LHAGDADLVNQEPDLEKRSELALAHAEKAIEQARKAYTAGEIEAFQSGLNEAASLARISYKSLQDTGKPARKKPKYWKRAEKKLRELVRRAGSFEKDVSLEDRPAVQALEQELSDLRDRVLNDIMTKK
jgi:hypothetical protein